MLRLTLAQMRRSLGRLASGGIAIAIGTAFVAATLLAGGVMTRTSYDSVAATLADADLLVEGELTSDDLGTLRGLPGVDAVQPDVHGWLEVRAGGGKRASLLALPRTSDPRLDPLELVDGRLPDRPGEIALPAVTAERIGVRPGDDVVTSRVRWVPSDPAASPGPTSAPAAERNPDPSETAAEGSYESEDYALEVTGLLEDPRGAYLAMGGAAVLPLEDVQAVSGAASLDELQPRGALLALDPAASASRVTTSVTDALDGVEVLTPDEAAVRALGRVTQGADVFTGLVLGFASIALVVAALVIANTFQVLVAQRTRTLALLRCVGALRRQVRRSVLVEAAILGSAASFVGLLTGTLLAQVALLVLQRVDLDVPLPTTVTLTPWVVLVPLAVGTSVTVLAALLPARAATRVAPVAALRPAELAEVGGRGGRARLALSLLLTAGGFVALAGGVGLGMLANPMVGLALGVLGGATSFVGILLGAVFWVPRVVGLVGRTVAGNGPTARLATANTLRNPRRTAATSTALLIGVTLVALMSTGAASARVTLDQELDERYPVDVQVTAFDDGTAERQPIGDAVEDTLATADGVAGTATLASTLGRLDPPRGGEPLTTDVYAVTPAVARSLMRDGDVIASLLRPGAVVLGADFAKDLGIVEGDVVSVAARASWEDPSTPQGGRELGLRAAVVDLGGQTVYVTPDVLDGLSPDAPETRVWVRLDDVTDAGTVVPALSDALADESVEVNGSALERAGNQRLIDTLLAIVVGLLGVAVLIALVGVANTLSLSVLERRRESATLRAIGLSRRRLRWMLAIEGALIAGVGAALGVGLGMVYGWAGSATLLGAMGDVVLSVTWWHLALVLVVALAAGMLASVLPGRAAARTSPVAALGVD
ncbi:ABC transporter permease [Cellulomonas cellasea]|uniref:Putative ABC transport system permease protein n=1 Tax=Cellulomonas cellasea TaxID=43670 RepID=A0A7W4YAS1_9CELL|nr:ABC transporter permease [Cellulomonas cellasea]MBB2922868.1 putative ABC transport system permease protein [Cellulomonas cellasea]